MRVLEIGWTLERKIAGNKNRGKYRRGEQGRTLAASERAARRGEWRKIGGLKMAMGKTEEKKRRGGGS